MDNFCHYLSQVPQLLHPRSSFPLVLFVLSLVAAAEWGVFFFFNSNLTTLAISKSCFCELRGDRYGAMLSKGRR